VTQYAFGWTTDLQKSISLVGSYLKQGGMFVFSWDHPLTPCLNVQGENVIISKSYHDEDYLELVKDNQRMTLKKWKLSSYINAFKKAGLVVDEIIEEVDEDVHLQVYDDLGQYYSKDKAKLVPLSIIIKAIKK